MYLVFYRTTDVFEAEEILQSKGISVEISPTPVQDKEYYEVCVQMKDVDLQAARDELGEFDFQIIP